MKAFQDVISSKTVRLWLRNAVFKGNEDGEDVGDAADDEDSNESAAHQQGSEDLMKIDATSEGTEDMMKVDATSEGPRDLMDNTEELQEHEGTVDVSEGTADAKVAAKHSSDMVIPNGMVGAPAPSYSSLGKPKFNIIIFRMPTHHKGSCKKKWSDH